MFYRLRDFPKARTRQYPSSNDLGIRSRALKLCSEHFEAVRERFGALDQRRIRRRRRRRRRRGIGILVDQLVGEQQRGEQELARFRQRPEAGERLATLAVDEARGGAEILLLALAARHLVGAACDIEVDQRGHQTAASRISSSSSSTTSRTLARNSSSRPALAGVRDESAFWTRSMARSALSRAAERPPSSI